MTFKIKPHTACDYYKIGHKDMYEQGTTKIYSNFTPRSVTHASKLPEVFNNKIVFFGLQGFIKSFLIDCWNENFFNQPKGKVVAEYASRVSNGLCITNPDTSHIEALHDLGFLPLKIKALPEGSLVDVKVPVLTVTNTIDEFFWLPNYIESVMSAELWKASTTATTAYQYRKLLDNYADKTASPKDFVLWQGHDFSFRGLSGVHDAAASGAGHLLSFLGTDTIPAMDYVEDYYSGKDTFIGGSVPASEHSVMTLSGAGDEIETIRRLIKDTFPTGVVSVVSDSYDYWKVITEYVPKLKGDILSRKPNSLGLNKTVFRPDCYAEGTKILTDKGWVDFKYLNEESLVAQVTEDGYEFVKPIKIVNQEYTGDMIRFKDGKGKVDFTVTPNHRMVSYTKMGESIKFAEDLKVGNHSRTFARSAPAKSSKKSLTNFERLNIAFQADGSYCTNSTSTIRFHFSKQRKIDRMVDLLDSMDLFYSLYEISSGGKEFNIKIDPTLMSKNFDWVDCSTLSKEWSQEFIEELSYWDTCRRTSTRFKFDSTNKTVIDVVELVSIAAGYGIFISEYEDSRKEHFSNVFTANIMKPNMIGGQALTKELVQYSGNVYCVQVPSGKIIVKNNAATLVCGNSGNPVDIICGTAVKLNVCNNQLDMELAVEKYFLSNSEQFNSNEGYEITIVNNEGKYNTFVVSSHEYDGDMYYEISCSWETEETPELKGSVECLWEIFGGTTTDKGYKLLDCHVGLIYGDSITLERAQEILKRLEAKGFASGNIVFGIGSYTYQYQTRDSLGFAMKATYGVVNGQPRNIFKDPKTDSGTKKSAKGLLRVESLNGDFALFDEQTPEQEAQGELKVVFEDSVAYNIQTLAEVRNLLHPTN